MRKFIVIVFLAAIIAFGAYSAMWFIQAGNAKAHIEQIIAKANEKQKHINYESISTSGFPNDVIVSIAKPKFAGRVDEIFSGIAMPASNSQNLQTLPEWDTEVALDGYISFRINVFSNHYSVSSFGNMQFTNTIAGVTDTVISQSSGYNICSVKLERSQGWYKSLWDMSFANSNINASDDFREFDCVFPASTTVDTETKETLSSLGSAQFFISNNPDSVNRNLRIYIKVSDSEFTEAGVKWLEPYLQAIFKQGLTSNRFAAYGKQNLEFDLSIKGPLEASKYYSGEPFDINLSKFTINNQLYDANLSAQISSNGSSDSRSGKVVFKSESNFSEKYDQIMPDIIKELVQQMYLKKDTDFAMYKPALEQNTPEQIYDVIYSVVPNFHSFGKIMQSLDLSFQGTQANGVVNLADMSFSIPAYGISANGNAKLSEGQVSPSGTLNLICTNCPRLVDESFAYAGKLIKAASVFSPDITTKITIEPRLAEGVKKFLEALSEPPKDETNKVNFTYNIVSDGMMGLSINGKPLDQIIALYAEHIGSILKAETVKSDKK